MTLQLEDVHYPLFASQVHHVEGKILENVIVAILIGCGKGRLSDRIPTKSEMIALILVSLQDCYQITQTFAVTKLSKHQGQQLVPAGEVLDIMVAVILPDIVIELTSVQKRGELREYVFRNVHAS